MRRLAVSAILLTAVLLTGSRAGAADAPTAAFAGGALALGHLPPVLVDEAVAPHLKTGLTTVFLFTVETKGTPQQKGAAQVAVRYDLWDEVYRIELSPAPGGLAASTTSVAATDGASGALLGWWRAAAVRVAPAAGAWQPPLGRAKITLQVLPFSQAEQRDAQEWLLRSFRADSPPGRPAPTTALPPRAGAERTPAAAPVREFYGAMLASSIGRRSLTSWSWNVTVETR
jgi:hypothetical protein